MKTTKYTGYFTYEKQSQLENFLKHTAHNVIKRDNEIVVEWDGDEGLCVTTLAISPDGKCTGTSAYTSAKWGNSTASVEAAIYTNKFGYVIIGKENWPDEPDCFVLQLTNPQAIADE
ncbi:hypothetical protein BH11PLA2_BH11PLA2_09290 [soil metagenome]